MSEVTCTIGHKEYSLQAQPGEERLVRRAAAVLDDQAQDILAQAGRLPEPRLLLLVGLMLADRLNAMEERAVTAERENARMKASATTLGEIPSDLRTRLDALAGQAESLVARAEELVPEG